MRARGLDILLATDPANMYYLSAYDGWSFYVPQCLILSADEELPLWWGRGIDVAGAHRTAQLPPERIIGYSDDYVHNPPAHPMQHLAQTLSDLAGGGQTCVGYEGDGYYFSPMALSALQEGLPQARWQESAGLVNWLRAVKEEQEIDCMKKAGRIAAAMQQAALDAARAGEADGGGAAKNKIAAAIYHAAISGVDGIYGDYAAIVPMLPSGADAAAPHLTWDDQPFAADSGMFIELAGCYRRYHCPLARTIYLGAPPAQWRRAEAALIEGIDDCLRAATPGAVCGDVARALEAALARHGFSKSGRCGYSIGIGYPPDWGERTMSFRPQDETPLQEGMCFHLMPGLWQEDWGIEITESIVIRAGGGEPLSDFPRRLLAA